MGAILEIRAHRPAANGADLGRPERERTPPGSAGFIENPATAFAFQVWLSPFDREERDEEKAHIVVQTSQPGGGKAALGAGPRLVIHVDLFGLYTADKKEEDAPPNQVSRTESLEQKQSFGFLL